VSELEASLPTSPLGTEHRRGSELEASLPTSPLGTEHRRGNATQVANAHLGTVELRIPSKPEWVAVARLTIAAIANRLPFSVEEIEDLKLAIAEACTNVIQSESGADSIEIVVETGSAELKIHVRDHGAIRIRQAVAAPLGGVPVEGGLGVFLIQALMDSVEQSANPESGNQLVMTKRVGS